MTTEIVVTREMELAEENELITRIRELEDAISSVAEQSVRSVIGEEDYTALEIEAMIAGKKLELTNALELAAVLFRGKYIEDIESNGLVMMHPGQYSSLAQMAEDNGISQAELSKTLNLVRIIFPKLIELEFDIAQVWGRIGKSKMAELVPVLRQLITDEESDSARVRTAVQNILNDIAATNQVAEIEMDEDQMRDEAVRQLVDDAERLSFRQLRTRLDPGVPTPAADAAIIPVNGNRVFVTVLTTDQWAAISRRLGGTVDPHFFELPEDTTLRRREASMIPEIRTIIDLLDGVE